ncbi:AMP-binding protein [Bradyrhizobium sp. LA7.1]|uniref:class I adenylate-forming enzyme family protein n=1 Tax=Bradyrhizobium sp. LA7.1 TaxID=3156324 RepID=UPI00339B93EA
MKIIAGDLVRQGLKASGARTVIHEMDGSVRTGETLLRNIDLLASALAGQGLAGKTIGLWYQNSIAAIEAFLAVEWIGAVRLAVDPNAPPAEVEAIFQAANVAAMLTDDRGAKAIRGNALVHDTHRPLHGSLPWRPVTVDGDRTAILYPRAVQPEGLFAVPLSYSNWDATLRRSMSLFRSGRYGPWQENSECLLSCQQIMHGTGFVATFPFLAMGVPQVIVREFEPDAVIEAIDRHAVTSTMLVPVMLQRLTLAADRFPKTAASLRHILYGGGKVELSELRRAIDVFGPILSQLYGRFEGGWPISILDPSDHEAISRGRDDLGGSCGRVIDGIEMKLKRSDGQEAGCGELCVRGPMVVREYADADGWCSLGDLMSVDGDGYISYRGRHDRMINTGYHIYPQEIETVISEVAGVGKVRVLGEVNKEWGQTVVAYLVIGEGCHRDQILSEVKQVLAGRLARYKIPRIFRLVEELPPLQ